MAEPSYPPAAPGELYSREELVAELLFVARDFYCGPARLYYVAGDDITGDTHFRDMGDSIDVIEFAMHAEERLGAELPDEISDTHATVHQIADYLVSVGARAPTRSAE